MQHIRHSISEHDSHTCPHSRTSTISHITLSRSLQVIKQTTGTSHNHIIRTCIYLYRHHQQGRTTPIGQVGTLMFHPVCQRFACLSSPTRSCHGLETAALARIASQHPRASCYIPRPEIRINGGESTIIPSNEKRRPPRQGKFTGTFTCVAAQYHTPLASQQPVATTRVLGSVLRRQLSFHQVGFSPTG